MSWFSFLRLRRGAPYPNGNPGQAAEAMPYTDGITRSVAGVNISADEALSVSAMFRAVTLISNIIGAFPINISEEQPDKSKKLTEYEIDSCIWRRPNHQNHRTDFWAVVVGHLVMNANAFLIALENEEGFELWVIEPERVEVARLDDGRKAYRVDGDKLFYDFIAGGDIIHIAGWGRNGLFGVSPVEKMANALGLAKASEEYASRFFSNGTVVGGVLQTEQAMNAEQAREMKARWDATHRGLRNFHESAVLSHGLKWQKTGESPEDAQMIDTRQFQVAEAGRITGAPENLIGSHDKQSSWGQGLEINNRAFLQFTLGHIVIRIEQAIDDDFLANPRVNPDKRYPRHMKFNQNALMRGTSAERLAFYTGMFMLGAYTINDILRLEDLPGIGTEGDIRFVPANNLSPLSAMVNVDPDAPKSSERLLREVADILARAGVGAQGPGL